MLIDGVFYDKNNVVKTKEGYIRIKKVRIARTGVQKYFAGELFNDDGSLMFPEKEPTAVVVLYRPAKEVFHKDAMDSFKNIPVTNQHPRTAKGMPLLVDATNIKRLGVGFSGAEIEQEGSFLVADLHLTDSRAIKDFESGRRQISNGYIAPIVRKSGVTEDGVAYDAIQTEIRGNHIALVDNARCGPSCSIQDEDKTIGDNMTVIVIDEVTHKVEDDTLATAIKKVLKERDDLKVEKGKLVGVHDAAMDTLKDEHKKSMDKLQAELDTAKDNQITPEKLDTILDERLAIFDQAKSLMPDIETKGKTCMAIKREVVKHVSKSKIPEDRMKNDVYIDARFDAIVEMADVDKDKRKKSTDKMKNILSDAASVDDDKNDCIVKKAYDRRLIRNKVVAKLPVGATPAMIDEAIDAEIAKQSA